MDLIFGLSLSAYRVEYAEDEALVHVNHQAGIGRGREDAVRERALATCLEVWAITDGYTDHDVRLQSMPAAWLAGENA